MALGGLSAGMGSPNNALNGQNSQASQHSNSQASAANSSSGGGDPLSQAYTGIQQYAGLSSLLGQGNVHFFHSFSVACPPRFRCLKPPSPMGRRRRCFLLLLLLRASSCVCGRAFVGLCGGCEGDWLTSASSCVFVRLWGWCEGDSLTSDSLSESDSWWRPLAPPPPPRPLVLVLLMSCAVLRMTPVAFASSSYSPHTVPVTRTPCGSVLCPVWWKQGGEGCFVHCQANAVWN
jgi:hypothetical protein